ncbi:MAG: CDP-alcohol phosphatidyltransferase family protein [Candidatus Nanopelagicus sp.]
MNKGEFFSTWSSLHGQARVSGIVKWWLNISYVIVRRLVKLRVTPNGLTVLGLVFGVLLYLNSKSLWALLFLILSLLSDGLDGSMAIVTQKFSNWGAMLDSVTDRATEVFWVLALYSIGVNINILIAAFLFSFIQEYLRARAGGVGVNEVGVVTFAERPVRAAFVFVVLIAYNLDLKILDSIILIWLLLQLISLLKLSRYIFLKLN